MPRIADLRRNQCRFVITDGPPHLCCGEETRDASVSYCPEHCAVCFDGRGKDWKQLVEMIYGVEQTVVRVA